MAPFQLIKENVGENISSVLRILFFKAAQHLWTFLFLRNSLGHLKLRTKGLMLVEAQVHGECTNGLSINANVHVRTNFFSDSATKSYELFIATTLDHLGIGRLV